MRRLITGLAALSLALVAAGCGGSDNGGSDSTGTSASSEAGGNSDAVAWADKVCSGIKDDIAAVADTPEIDQTNPQAAKDGLVAYLGTLTTSLDGMASAVNDAGTPPVDGGEAAVKDFLDQISSAKESVASAKSKIEAAPVSDPAAFQAAVAGATSDLGALGDLDPTGSFSDNKELEEAYNKAESCKEIESTVSSTPTS
jgi:hypothetical protein